MNAKITKDHAYRMSLSGFISAATVIAILWVFAEPIIIDSVSAAMQSNITEAVKYQVAPINNAFIVLLQRDINNTKKDIAALKYKQRRNDHWTANDASDLADLEIELDALKEAMKALKENRT